MRRLCRMALVLAACALAGGAVAGPVPGVETLTKSPVEFPHPAHLSVWSVGENEYLVTFRWKPEAGIEKPGVAGTFNGWSRTDLPMAGPDADGVWSVTARMPGGDHRYKFVSGTEGWHPDPKNPESESQGGNSILRLGISALLHDAKAERGDGRLEARAFAHHPESWQYVDPISEDDVVLRFRTLRGDASGVTITLTGVDGGKRSEPMGRVASDSMFDFYEYHLIQPDGMPVRAGGAKSPAGATPAAGPARVASYSFVVQDGATKLPVAGEHALSIDSNRLFHTPKWARDAVWYQIMVDRFRDGDPSNNPEHTVGSSTKRSPVTHPWTSDWYKEQPWENDGKGRTFWKWAMYDRLYGGDFEGVIQKLDYLRDLGVTAIYLNPVFESSNAHKYNSRSYVFADDGYGVPGEFDKAAARVDFADPKTWVFGKSDEKLLELIRECKKRKIHIILDGVFNHLGDDALPFLDVKEKRQASKFADWYDVTSWDPFKYTGWAGFDGLPQFRKSADTGLASPSLRDHIFAVTRRWMDPNGDGDPSDGIDGWRLDVPMDVPKPFWVEWRRVVKSANPDAYITGEIWDPAEQWLDGTTFDAVMNYQFSKIAFRYFGDRQRKITATKFDEELSRLRVRYPRSATYVLQNLYDSHDTDRWVSRLANPDMDYDGGNRKQDPGAERYMDRRPPEKDYQRLKLMAVFQATYVGAPMIWYGTEVGMFGADDPMCRMPMWWEELGPYGNPEYKIMPELRSHFRGLFHLRQGEEVLRAGDYGTVLADDARDVFAFVRHLPGAPRAMLVVLNNSDAPQTVELPAIPGAPAGFGNFSIVHGAIEARSAEGNQKLIVTLPPVTGGIVAVQR